MEIALATFGGILLLFGVASQTLLKSTLVQPSGSDFETFRVDRIAASLIGMALTATAIVVWSGAPVVSVVSTFGVAAGLTVLYVLILSLSHSK